MRRARAAACAACAAASLTFGAGSAALALPPPTAPPPPPRSAPTASPAPAATGSVLPYGSPIFFVIDDKISSGSTAPGTLVHMHLQNPLVVAGTTLAPAETPATFTVVNTAKAQTGDVDGAIQIHLDPLTLPGRNVALPIRAFHEYLTIEMTSGQLATRSTTDTIADVFVPYHVLYHALRPGHQMVLPQGSILRAETDASIDARNPKALVIATPPPFVSTYDSPHADLTAAPFYTPAPLRPHPLPHGKPTLPPKPSSPAPSAGAASPSANAPASPSANAPASSPPASSPPATSAPSAAPIAAPSPKPT